MVLLVQSDLANAHLPEETFDDSFSNELDAVLQVMAQLSSRLEALHAYHAAGIALATVDLVPKNHELVQSRQQHTQSQLENAPLLPNALPGDCLSEDEIFVSTVTPRIIDEQLGAMTDVEAGATVPGSKSPPPVRVQHELGGSLPSNLARSDLDAAPHPQAPDFETLLNAFDNMSELKCAKMQQGLEARLDAIWQDIVHIGSALPDFLQPSSAEVGQDAVANAPDLTLGKDTCGLNSPSLASEEKDACHSPSVRTLDSKNSTSSFADVVYEGDESERDCQGVLPGNADNHTRGSAVSRRSSLMRVSMRSVEELVQVHREVIHSFKFDSVMGCLIILNILLMLVELEKKGYAAAVNLQLKPDSGFWSGSSSFFKSAEHFFNAAFCLELIGRIGADGCQVLRQKTVAFDALIVVTSGVDYILKYGLKASSVNINFLRMARLVKLIRLFSAFKAAPIFSELRILIKTLVGSMRALIWSCVLLFFILLFSAIVLTQMVSGMLDDTQHDPELRVWAYEHYGTGSRSFYTLFEATLSGGWPKYARPLIEDVSAWYVIFWLLYVPVVWFAVMRVITAIFLQKTMKMATQDDELMLNEKLTRGRNVHVDKIQTFLTENDADGNRKMNHEELEELLEHPNLQNWLELIDLEGHDVLGLYEVLKDETGEVSHEDLVGGILRLAGGMRAVDLVVIMHGQRQISLEVNRIVRALERRLDGSLKRVSTTPFKLNRPASLMCVSDTPHHLRPLDSDSPT